MTEEVITWKARITYPLLYSGLIVVWKHDTENMPIIAKTYYENGILPESAHVNV